MSNCFDKECKSRLPQSLERIVIIDWIDASYQRGELYLKDIVSPGVKIQTCGLLIQETDEFYSLALDFYPEDGAFRYVSHIPKVNVINIRSVAFPQFIDGPPEDGPPVRKG